MAGRARGAGPGLEQISWLMSHNAMAVTELVYRRQLGPIMEHGAEAMDRIFKASDDGPSG
ncbi:hypothetical protein [Actinophytocola sp. KF-1]